MSDSTTVEIVKATLAVAPSTPAPTELAARSGLANSLEPDLGQQSSAPASESIRALVFQTRTGPKGPVFGIQIGRNWVFQGQVEWTWRLARESMPTLAFLKPLKVQAILNDPLWRTRKFGTRIAIGRCLKLFVRRNLIPLLESNPGKKGPRKYVPADSLSINRADVE